MDILFLTYYFISFFNYKHIYKEVEKWIVEKEHSVDIEKNECRLLYLTMTRKVYE